MSNSSSSSARDKHSPLDHRDHGLSDVPMSPYVPPFSQQELNFNGSGSSSLSNPWAVVTRLVGRKRRRYLVLLLGLAACLTLWYAGEGASPTAALGRLGSPVGRWDDHYDDDDDAYDSSRADSHSSSEKSSASAPHPKNGPGRHPISNGLLHVDLSLPASKHPIYQLVADAEEEWAAKQARQSKTLKEAVAEYKRRNNGRNPPKGFDKWWQFVIANKVPLPDEYDLINKDLYPFLAFTPSALRQLVRDTITTPETYTISIRNGKADYKMNFDEDKIGGSRDRVMGQLSHIENVTKWIPDLDAVFNIHDTPKVFVSAGHKAELEELIEGGEYWDPDNEADRAFSTWGAACRPSSPLHTLHPVLGSDPSSLEPNLTALNVPFAPSELFMDPKTKTFIADHVNNMDLCVHPDIINLHGATSGTKPVPQAELLPIFSLSRTALHSDVLVIPTEQWGEKQSGDFLPFDKKSETRLLWRGRNTGGYYSKDKPWRSFHRSRLAAMVSSDIDEKIAVLPAPGAARTAGEEGVLLERAIQRVREGDLNDRLLDIGLAYEPIQCSKEDGTCDEIVKDLVYATARTFDEENKFKYILDIDGNSWSARYKRLLSTGSLILKSTIFPEWWNDRSQPWVHYVPIKVDYGDLYDVMQFFRGDEQGKAGEEAMAQKIAEQGTAWSSSSWRRVDMTAYMFRLYLEWARLVALNREAMDFVLE